MEILLCYAIIYLVEALILWLYCNDLFTARYSLRRTAITLSILYSLMFFLSLFNLNWINGAAFLIVNFIFIYFFYDSSWSTALFHAGITTIAMSLGELLLFSLFPDFARHFYETQLDPVLLIICSFSSKLIYFFIIYILSHLPITHTNKKITVSRGTLVLVPIPLVSFFIIITLFTIYHTTDISDFLNKMIAICCVLLLLLNLLIWFFFSYTQRRNQDFIELQLNLQRENDSAEYYKMLSTQNEARNILIHNIKGHLHTIAALAEQNQQSEIIDYISTLTTTASLQSSDTLQLCKNDTLNAILCRYKEECKKQEICFKTDIRNDCIDFMTANDLTALFCNLLDNAMEAASCVSDSFIEVNLFRQENAPYAILCVQNSCPEDPFDAHGRLSSHKKNSARHGLGLKSIQRTVKNYGGDMELYYAEGTGTFHAVVRLKAVDRH